MKLAHTVTLALLIALGVGCGGYNSSQATTPSTPAATPTITALAPDNANSGATGVVLTVNGSDFSGTATINWNGKALTTSFVSAGQLTTTIPDADLTTAGTVPVTVTNPGISGGIYGGGTTSVTSNSMTFTIN